MLAFRPAIQQRDFPRETRVRFSERNLCYKRHLSFSEVFAQLSIRFRASKLGLMHGGSSGPFAPSRRLRGILIDLFPTLQPSEFSIFFIFLIDVALGFNLRLEVFATHCEDNMVFKGV